LSVDGILISRMKRPEFFSGFFIPHLSVLEQLARAESGHGFYKVKSVFS